MRASNKLLLAAALCFSMSGVAQAKEAKEYKVTKDAVEGACDENLQSNGGVEGCTIGCKSGGKQAICDYSCGGPEGPGCRKFVFTRMQTLKPGYGWIDRPKVKRK